MYQTNSNITPKYCSKTHYSYLKNSGFGDSYCSPLLCYRFATTTLTAQIPTETLSQSHRLCFIGKERDSETGFSYFGARYYDSDILTGWLSVDPMADKYPSLLPYDYCGWNPVKLVDPDGRMVSPIYDADGNFLGTDDKGLQGEALIMNKADFHQGMSNEEARTKGRTLDNMSNTQALEFANNGNFKEFLNHYNSLSSRPDWDGFVTISEGIQWAKDHPNALKNITSDNTLYINATLLNLGSLTISNCG